MRNGLGTCQNVLFDPIVSGNVDFSGGTAAWKLCGIQCRAYFRRAQQNLRTVAGTPEFGIPSRCNQVDLVAGGDESGQTVAGLPGWRIQRQIFLPRLNRLGFSGDCGNLCLPEGLGLQNDVVPHQPQGQHDPYDRAVTAFREYRLLQ